MRGEHITYGVEGATSQGSSPHARGTRVFHPTTAQNWGIIPACAGNTPIITIRVIRGRDHPRMRGEHLFIAEVVNGMAGSSPHARGTLRQALLRYA